MLQKATRSRPARPSAPGQPGANHRGGCDLGRNGSSVGEGPPDRQTSKGTEIALPSSTGVRSRVFTGVQGVWSGLSRSKIPKVAAPGRGDCVASLAIAGEQVLRLSSVLLGDAAGTQRSPLLETRRRRKLGAYSRNPEGESNAAPSRASTCLSGGATRSRSRERRKDPANAELRNAGHDHRYDDDHD